MANAKKQQAGKQELIHVEKLRRTSAKITIVGDTPLIVNAWNRKTIEIMLAKHMGETIQRQAKDPCADFLGAMYRFDDGHYGFPVVAVKAAMATITADLPGISRAQVYRNIVVTGRRGFQIAAFAEIPSPMELAELFSPNPPAMREDMVKTSGFPPAPDIHYRAEFWPWALRFTLAYSDTAFAGETVVNLLQQAGFGVGLGEWRQEKGGSNGLFHVADKAEAKTADGWARQKPKVAKLPDPKVWLSSTVAKYGSKEKKTTAADKPAGAPRMAKKRGNGHDESVSGRAE